MTTETNDTAKAIEALATELGLSMTTEFVPWSSSRNKGEKQPSLNWIVTIHKGNRVVWSGDYGAGMGHCPSYKQRITAEVDYAVKAECHDGRAYVARGNRIGKPILPAFADVIHSLMCDSSAIDHASFDDWASDYGYDIDSRKAEAIYRACLAIALAFRNALGDVDFQRLRDAVRDY